MNLVDLAVKTIQEENKRKPYPTKQEYEQEVLSHIEKCRGKTIKEIYQVFE